MFLVFGKYIGGDPLDIPSGQVVHRFSKDNARRITEIRVDLKHLELPVDYFEDMTNLQTMSLTGVNNLCKDMFNGLDKLEELNLNVLDHLIPADLFTTIPNLNDLYLASDFTCRKCVMKTPIILLSKNLFTPLGCLTKLILNFAHAEITLQQDTLNGLVGLKTLYLAGISDIHQDVFTCTPSLEKVVLDTELTKVQEKLQKKYPNIEISLFGPGDEFWSDTD